jgi:predicted Zn-dependent protease
MLLGAAVIVGGAAAGQDGSSEAGQGIIAGSQQLAQRNFLAYARAQESAADQAALSYLTGAKMSAKGMLDLFQVLANQSIGSLQIVNRYVMSHPMPFDRIRTLEQNVKRSPYFNQRDSDAMMLRHRLMQAKLVGFMEGAQQVYRKYPKSDNSLPGRYARAIAAYRVGDLKNAIPLIDSLIEVQPRNAYFWELKGQALFEGGRPSEAVAPLQQAAELKPEAGLIQILLAQAMLGSENSSLIQPALRALQKAERMEGSNPQLWRQTAQAYGRLGDIPRADLATAQAALLMGDRDLATQKAKEVQRKFNRGSPEWLRANDILNFASKKKG